MPELPISQSVISAERAVEHAQSVRRYHARRTRKGSTQRETDIQFALDRLKASMGPLRVFISGFPYGAQTTVALQQRQSAHVASKALQRERQKLWKMQKRKEASSEQEAIA